MFGGHAGRTHFTAGTKRVDTPYALRTCAALAVIACLAPVAGAGTTPTAAAMDPANRTSGLVAAGPPATQVCRDGKTVYVRTE